MTNLFERLLKKCTEGKILKNQFSLQNVWRRVHGSLFTHIRLSWLDLGFYQSPNLKGGPQRTYRPPCTCCKEFYSISHIVHTYREYPSSELGLSHPLSCQRASPGTKGGGAHSRAGEGLGGGGPIPTTEEKLCTLPTLCYFCNRRLAPLNYVPTKRHVKLTVSKCAICVFRILKKNYYN
jgi:hypothetical protein